MICIHEFAQYIRMFYLGWFILVKSVGMTGMGMKFNAVHVEYENLSIKEKMYESKRGMSKNFVHSSF